jgi:hypothetical protein
MRNKLHIKIRSLLALLALLAGTLIPAPPVASAAASLELYGTFQAMGVVVTVGSTDDPDRDAVASVAYRVSGSGTYRSGFPLSRVSSTRFAGSLFWLQAGTTYDVQVTFSDPDGGPLNGVVVQASAATRAEISVPAPSLSYYVSPAGGGTACSLASPCPLAYALTQAQPGQAVVLRGGTYTQGGLTLPRSGTPGAPIVIQSYPGETAILDGGDLGPFTWTAQGSGVYRATVNAADPHLVMSNGQRLYPYQSLANLQSLSWGIPGFYADGTTLYVHLTGGANPGTTTMLVSRYNTAFTVNRNFIYFLNLTFTHYGLGSYAKALYFYNGSDNLVQGCTFAVNDLGIGLKYASHRNVVQDNTFYDTDFTWPWDAVKAGSELETGGIRMYDPMTGRGTIIRRNTFHDYFDGFGVCPESDSGATNETDVYGNLVYNAGDDGMETDGQCSNVRIWGNTFHDVLVGISLAPVYTGPVYALRNLIYRTGAGNSSYPGSPFKFNSGYDQSGPMYLIHNTADAVLPGNDGLDIKSPGTWTLIYARNNIWAGTEYALSNANPSQPLSLDYDDLYTTLLNELVWWDGLSDRHLRTLAELQAATNQELHGRSVVPGFVNAAGGDYTLDASSQLVDAGLLIPGIDDDFNGTAPDVGAFEFTPALDLRGYPGDGTIRLDWAVNITLPPTSTWQIAYYSQTIASAITVTGILSPTRAYTLTGLTNHAWYTVTLNALLDDMAFLTDTIRARPTDDWVYLPLVIRN